MYKIAEVFRSVQAEGARAGHPALFVRFAGCNLNCAWCDTDHAMRERYTTAALGERILKQSRPGDDVIFTGGEPLVQVKQNDPLMEMLRGKRWLSLETNGTFPIPGGFQWRTVSPKAGSVLRVDIADELKLVLQDGVDPEAVRGAITAEHYSIQACSGNLDPTMRYVLDHPGWRLSVQWHKLVGIR